MNSEANELCPICEEGRLVPFSRIEKVSPRDGDSLSVRLDLSKCTVCGTELTTPAQTKVNQRRIADARRIADGLLTGNEIRKFRETFGITQAEAAQLFGGGPNSFSKYERGEILQSTAMDRLIRVTNEFPQIFPYLGKLATGVQPKLRIHERLRVRIDYSAEEFLARPVCKAVVSVAQFRQVPSANQNDHGWTNDPSKASQAVNG